MAEGPSSSQIPPGWPQCSQQLRALLSICETDRPHPRWPGWAYSQAERPPNATPFRRRRMEPSLPFSQIARKDSFGGQGREGRGYSKGKNGLERQKLPKATQARSRPGLMEELLALDGC